MTRSDLSILVSVLLKLINSNRNLLERVTNITPTLNPNKGVLHVMRYLITIVLSSFLIFATPASVSADSVPVSANIQAQITQLSNNVTALTQKSETIDSAIRSRITKNAGLDEAIADKKREREQISSSLAASKTTIEEYSRRVAQLENSILRSQSEINEIQKVKSIGNFVAGPAIDIASKISGLDREIRSSNERLSRARREQNRFQSELQQNQGKYQQLSRQLVNLEQQSQSLTSDMKRGKHLLMRLNTLSQNLKIKLDETQEIKDNSSGQQHIKASLLEEISQLNQSAQEVIREATGFLTENA